MSYDLEMYAKALEAISNFAPRSQRHGENHFDYAKTKTFDDGFRYGMKQAAKMLHMSPGSLYTMYPDHFPEPPKEERNDTTR